MDGLSWKKMDITATLDKFDKLNHYNQSLF